MKKRCNYSEEDDILYGYAVLLYDKDTIDCFDIEDLILTAKKFKREDFYWVITWSCWVITWSWLTRRIIYEKLVKLTIDI